MKKYTWIVALLLALTLAFVFIGCGGGDDDGDNGGKTPGGETPGGETPGGETPDWVAGGDVTIGDIVKISGASYSNSDGDNEGTELGKYKSKDALKLDVVTIQENGTDKKVNRIEITFDELVSLAGYEGITYAYGMEEISDSDLNGCSISTEFINSETDETWKLGYWANGTSPKTFSFATDKQGTAIDDDSEFDTLIILFDAWQKKPDVVTETTVYLYSVTLKEVFVAQVAPINVFTNGAFASGWSIDSGTWDNSTDQNAAITSGNLVVTPTSGNYAVKIATPAFDFTGYTRLIITWAGLYEPETVGGQDRELNGFACQTRLYFTEDTVVPHNPTVNNSPFTIVFEDEWVNWSGDNATIENSSGQCIGLSFYSNYVQSKPDYGAVDVAKRTPLVISSIVLQ